MKKNKIILNHCPNFYKIINSEYEEEDAISIKLINIYQDYIFNINEKDDSELKKVEQVDFIINKYLEDYSFRKDLKTGLLEVRVTKNSDLVTTIINSIINIFEKYEDCLTRNIYFARWI